MTGGAYRPEWTPEDAGSEFACRVMPGVDEEGKKRQPRRAAAPRKLAVDGYVEGILAGDRTILSRAITLIESNAPKHFDRGQEIIQKILPHTGGALRIGITGVPGAGKSTTIEALGCHLCDAGHKVAVLAVDPSSSLSKGSILGDKTRMENLSRRPEAFIRPSPSGGTLGGVTRKSRETLLLCEAAGYDVILVETVGVGQGETTVRSMARKAKKSTVHVGDLDARHVDEAVAVPDDNQIACLSAAIRATEAGKDGMAQRGASWARQDVRAVMASPLEQAIDHCAMFADSDLRRNGRTQWSEALADALTAARTTLMVMPISVAAEAGGLLDQAAARGLEVSGPEWRVSSAHEGG